MQVAKAALRKLRFETSAAHERPRGGTVEAAQPGVAQSCGDWPARTQILRIPCVIGRRERDGVAEALTPGCESHGSLCRDVNRVRAKLSEHAGDASSRRDGQPDFRVARARNRALASRGKDAYLVPARTQRLDSRGQCRHNTVRLRRPGIRCNRNPHAASATNAASLRSVRSTPNGQRNSCSSPFMHSTSAEQDSTQSPVLQYSVPSISRRLAR